MLSDALFVKPVCLFTWRINRDGSQSAQSKKHRLNFVLNHEISCLKATINTYGLIDPHGQKSQDFGKQLP